MNGPALAAAVAAHRDWFHCIDLGNGIVTPGSDGEHSRDKLQLMQLPAALHGQRVLDVGCCEGFFAFEAERRGAGHVLAIDTRPAALARFELCRQALGSRVESLQLNVYDLDPKTMGVFDVVFFLAVLHHLRYPFLALDRLASVTRGMLLIEVVEAVPATPTEDALLVRRSGERGQFKLLPNRRMLTEMLALAGFGAIEVLGTHRQKPVDPGKKLFGFGQQRVVVKARRQD